MWHRDGDVFAESESVLPHCRIKEALFAPWQGLVQVKEGLSGAHLCSELRIIARLCTFIKRFLRVLIKAFEYIQVLRMFLAT